MSEPPSLSRRWFRFSLRSLLIAVTLLCAGMAVVSNGASRQRRAIERIRAAHGVVFYDYQLDASLRPRTDDPIPPGPSWLRNLIGVDYFATVTRIQANVANDEFLEAAGDLPHLKALWIACDSKISDRGWEHLKNLTELESLYLRGMRNSSMANLSGLARLRTLYVTQTDYVSDDGIVHLTGLAQLQELSLWRTKVTSDGVRDLQKALPRCKIKR